MPLVECIECGAKVSPSAHTCPQCQRAPGGGICVICDKRIRIEDAFRITGWDLEAYRRSGVHLRSDQFAHQSCVLELFPDIEVPCGDCGAPTNVRKLALGSGPNLYTVESPESARWYSWSEHGWREEKQYREAAIISCPQCGSVRPLQQAETYPRSCSRCSLPLLDMHECKKEPKTGALVHSGCAQQEDELVVIPAAENARPTSSWWFGLLCALAGLLAALRMTAFPGK